MSGNELQKREDLGAPANNRDFGDRTTWLLIGAMCLLGLIVALTAYLLPHGRDSVFPPIKVY